MLNILLKRSSAVWFAVENSAHCDFVKLRNMLVRTHMQDLKDVTRETHYENYRAQCIQSMTRMVVKERNRKYAHTNTLTNTHNYTQLERTWLLYIMFYFLKCCTENAVKSIIWKNHFEGSLMCVCPPCGLQAVPSIV